MDRLDGMFAFAIADGQDLFVARDAIGIKPLYYSEDQGVFSLRLRTQGPVLLPVGHTRIPARDVFSHPARLFDLLLGAGRPAC